MKKTTTTTTTTTTTPYNPRDTQGSKLNVQTNMSSLVALFFFGVLIGSALTILLINLNSEDVQPLEELKQRQIELEATNDSLRADLDAILEEKEIKPSVYDRQADVSAYNVGDESQTSGDPCIGASGHDLCELIEWGIGVCAYNQVPLGTELEFISGRRCVVLDRTHEDYSHRIDLAFPLEADAMSWGVQHLPYRIIK